MDISAVKRQSHAVLQRQRRPILTASFLFLAVILVLTVLRGLLVAPDKDAALQFTNLYLAGDYDGGKQVMEEMQPATRDALINYLLAFLQAIVSFGFLMLMLKAIRGETVEALMLMDGFGNFARVLLLEILLTIILALSFSLFIIPGFIALYYYRMARYLLLIHPEFGVIDCLRESRLRTEGHRIQFLLLDLSFLGWALLACIPVLGLAVAGWLLPYWRGAELLYCEAINAPFEPVPEEAETNQPS